MSVAVTLGAQDLREVRLYGHLGRQFGRVHRLAVRTCREAAQALAVLLPGFERALLAHEPGVHVFRRRVSVPTNLAEERLDAPLGRGEAVCIVPAVAGAKRGGALQIIVGAALIAGAFVTGTFSLASTLGVNFTALGSVAFSVGVSLVLGGVVQALTPIAKSGGNGARPDNAPSYAFDGPVNYATQGVAVPLVYGRCIIGSVVASQGLSSVEGTPNGSLPSLPSSPVKAVSWMGPGYTGAA